jgi:hypothetical protein
MAENGRPKASDRRKLFLAIGALALLVVGWFLYSMMSSV